MISMSVSLAKRNSTKPLAIIPPQKIMLNVQFPAQNQQYWDEIILAAYPKDQDPWEFFFQLLQQFTITSVQDDRPQQTEPATLVFK